MTRKKQTSQTQDIGRPPIYGVPMIRTFASLRPDQIAWLRAQGDNVSETIRNIIDEAMARGGFNPRLHAGGDVEQLSTLKDMAVSIHASTREATVAGNDPAFGCDK